MVKALQFHRVLPQLQLCGTWNTPGQFDRFLHSLKRNNIATVLPGENTKGIVITFDDGESNVYYHAFPLLKKHGMKALVFLVVNYIGKRNDWDLAVAQRTHHLSWEHIHEMRDYGIEFGSHTMTHRNLTALNEDDVRRELAESRRIVAHHCGHCRSISYPFNRVNQMVQRIAAETGYTFGFGGSGQCDLCLKKEAIYITDTPVSFNIKVRERPHLLYRYERLKQTIINYFTIATMLSTKGRIMLNQQR